MAIPLIQLLEDPVDNEIKLWRAINAMRSALQGPGGPLAGWGFSSGPDGAGNGGFPGEVVYLGDQGQLAVDGTCLLFEDTLNKRVGVNTCQPAYPLDVGSNECDAKIIALRSGNLSGDIDIFPNYDVNPKARIRTTRAAGTSYAPDFSTTVTFYTSDSTDVLSARVSMDGTGLVDLKGATSFSGVLTPPAITSSQNDYNPTGLAQATVLRLVNNSGAVNITGLAGGVSGRVITIWNVGSNSTTLIDNSGSSAEANRFSLLADIVLARDAAVTLQYDSVSAKWRAINSTPLSIINGAGLANRLTLWSSTTALTAQNALSWSNDGSGFGYCSLAINTFTTPNGLVPLTIQRASALAQTHGIRLMETGAAETVTTLAFGQVSTDRWHIRLNNSTADPALAFRNVGTGVIALELGKSGQIGLGASAYGTVGQVLTSGGPSAAATWETPDINANIEDLDTAELSTVKVLRPDGAGGVEWLAPGYAEILVQDGACAPPVMLTSESECDFVYSEVV